MADADSEALDAMETAGLFLMGKRSGGMEFKEMLKGEEYGFLRENKHLGRHVILLGVAGSYAYGTNREDSDFDIRGIAVNRKSDILGMTRFEQYVDEGTDTVIYAFLKIVMLFLSCNPNVVELLGLRKEHYLYLHPIGKELLELRGMFLSRRAIQSFGGYADAQLRRMQNALARDRFPQTEKEEHIFRSVRNAMYDFNRRYREFEDGGLRLYIDQAVNKELETEIFVDVNLKHYPLRDYKNMWNEMHNVVKEYDKIGKRNRKKDDNHLNKHAMHLMRLFMMAIDILEEGKIETYREKEHALLMDIRNGKYQKADGMFREEFYEMLSEYERRLHRAAEHTSLPEEPDIKEVEDFVMSVHERVVKDEL